MADILLSRLCPACGTLTTATGSFTDAVLVGTCPRCAAAGTPTQVEIDNPRYVHPAQAENDMLKAALKPHDLEAENAQLRDKLKQKDPDAQLDRRAINPPQAIEDQGGRNMERLSKYFDHTGEVSNAAVSTPNDPPPKKD